MKTCIALLVVVLPSFAMADWSLHSNKNDFNGATVTTISTKGADNATLLAIGCVDGHGASINFTTLWVLEKGIRVSIDGQESNDPLATSSWERSRNYRGFDLWSSVQNLLSQLVKSQTLAFHVNDVSANVHTISFDLTGLKDGIEQLKAHCTGL